MIAALVLMGATPTPTPKVPLDNSKVTPGVLGPIVFAALIAAAFVLFRSMRKQLGRIPESFDQPPPER